MTTDAISEHAPALKKAQQDLLLTMERPDLVARMDSFTIRGEEQRSSGS